MTDSQTPDAATDRQMLRAAIRVILRNMGAAGERELELEIKRVQEAERDGK